MNSTKAFICILISLFTATAWSSDLEFDAINESDLERIVGDFSANFLHNTVSGASPLGTIFGFEVGLVGGISQTPEIEALIKEEDPNLDATAALPHAAILGQFTIPLGLTLEANLVPEIDGGDVKFSNLGIGLKWTLTETILPLPIAVAIRGSVTKTNITFNQTINNASTGNTPVDSEIEFESTSFAGALMVSRSFVVVEPYVGVGFVQGDGKMTVTGTGSIFDTTVITGDSAEAKKDGSMFMVGTEFNLLFLKIGVEYAKIIEAEKISGKLSFYF